VSSPLNFQVRETPHSALVCGASHSCSVLQCVAVCVDFKSLAYCALSRCQRTRGVAACCSALQRVAACCSALQCVAVRIYLKSSAYCALIILSHASSWLVKVPFFLLMANMLPILVLDESTMMHVSLLQCVAVYCCVLQCVALGESRLQYRGACHLGTRRIDHGRTQESFR